MNTRMEELPKVAGQDFDLCVIGGGAMGSVCALDAQLRGIRTALVEAGDFQGGTSSAVTKLMQGRVQRLYEAVNHADLGRDDFYRAPNEQIGTPQNAPYLTRKLEILVPTYRRIDIENFNIDSRIDNWLAGLTRTHAKRYLSEKDTLVRMPHLNRTGLVGSVLYADTQFDDMRYNIAVVQSFVKAGGHALNHVRVTDFRRGLDGRISGVVAKDQIADRRFAFNAKVVVNATGLTLDALRQMVTPTVQKRITLGKVAQILLPLEVFPTKDALLVPKTRDTGALIAMPWNGRLLVGTTDKEVDADVETALTEKDVANLLGNMNRFVRGAAKPVDVVSGFGIVHPRPLGSDKGSPRDLGLEQTIEVDQESALISIIGANLTTHWSTVENTINAVQDIIGLARTQSRTWNHVLYGSERLADDLWKRPSAALNLSCQTVNHLACKFGAATESILKLAQRNTDLAAPLVRGYPAIKSEVIYSVREEMAATIEDVLARRIGLQLYSWKMAMAAAPAVGALMAEELRWSDHDASKAIKEYMRKIDDLLDSAGQS